MAGTDQLRARVRELEQQLADDRNAFEKRVERIAWTIRNRCTDTQNGQLYALEEAMTSDLAGLSAALAAGSFSGWFDSVMTSIFYPDSIGMAVDAEAEGNSTDAKPCPFTTPNSDQ